MTAGCKVTTAFKTQMTRLPLQLLDAAHEGMELGMTEIARRARSKARWQADGTDNGKWQVTGTARKSITGYVENTPHQFEQFSVTDKYKRPHRSPEHQADPVNAGPTHVVGVLTMTEQHAGGLQGHEIRGTSTMAPGNPIVVEQLFWDSPYLWGLVEQVIARRLR
jgi:hypothetical protein